jgi:glycosyltransferase involved in cell wall biosynthesis
MAPARDARAQSQGPVEAALGGISVVVPAYDEEEQIADEIADLARVLATLSMESEILVVDDGSDDRTAELAARAGARVISHPENRGYGAALKTGIRQARFSTIVITDADGTYPADAIPAMLEKASAYDMVVGARTGASVADSRSSACEVAPATPRELPGGAPHPRSQLWAPRSQAADRRAVRAPAAVGVLLHDNHHARDALQ